MVQYCVATIGVKLSEKIGIRNNVIIGVIIIYISILIMIFFTNYYVILIAMAIFGLGVGIETLSVINNAWKYFPEHAALVNGIIITGLGISSGILTPIGDYLIINPDKEEPINGIYPRNVANNLKKFLYFLLILYLILGLIGIVLSFNFEEDDSHSEDNQKESVSIEINEKDSLIIDAQQNKQNNMGSLWEGFFSEKNFFLLLFCFSTPCKYII
jgi:MFS family permease